MTFHPILCYHIIFLGLVVVTHKVVVGSSLLIFTLNNLFNVYEGQIQSMTIKPMQIYEHEHFASKFH
jgi:hypothetical protein